MGTPLASKTTISSRNKIAQLNADGAQKFLVNPTHMQRPSQIARNRALQTPAASSRLANLANGFPSSVTKTNYNPTMTTTKVTKALTSVQSTQGMTNHYSNNNNDSRPTFRAPASRLPPHTIAKIGKQSLASTVKAAIPTAQSRIIPPDSRPSATAPLNSRSSSVLSSVSSATNLKRPSFAATPSDNKQNTNSNSIPDTNVIRKGLAKFSNPIECQRQFQALSLKIRQMNEVIEARENEIDQLQEQLKQAINMGVGYATTVQYFAMKLKLDSQTNLLDECEQLKSRVSQLMASEREYENRLEAIIDDYKNHLQVERDLRNSLEKELELTRAAHSKVVENLNSEHEAELDDLNKQSLAVKEELQDRIENLESELETRCKELVDLRKDHEILSASFSKLEESLTKDKDARVKYAQEKINQLQKDVDSLNSVLEMRLERIHALEKDSILLAEAQAELVSHQDTNKALRQQIESLNAALDRKREQFENLIVEHEKIRQELKRERKERRRMTMRTEQLEYVLNESCATESNMTYNTSIRDLDSADHVV